MLKIVILEDEKPQLDILTGLLEQYREAHPDFEYALSTYDRGVALLTEYRCSADLVLLDIRVPDMLGIDVARKLREMDENVMIVFITSLTQYAIDGYSVGAFDYILKPVGYPAFSAKLARALRVLSYRKPEVILDLRTKQSGYRVSSDAVTYIESSGHDIYVHTGEKEIKQWGTLGKFEALLKDAHFARCSTSYLVNLKYVQGVQKDEVMVNGTALPISRSKRKEFLSALAQYKGGSL